MVVNIASKSHGLTRYSILNRVVLAGIAGPLVALAMTWYLPFSVARNEVDRTIQSTLVTTLRGDPSDSVMLELETIAVGAPGFKALSSKSVLQAADNAIGGRFTLYGNDHELNVPFNPRRHEFGTSSWHLDIASFLVPSLLSSAYDFSGDTKYLRTAIDYVKDWSKFESSLLLPQGLIFNDHATAARAIIVTKLWRQYRNSDIYQTAEAKNIISYVTRISRLLLDSRLYEYRSNHGTMQNLSLLHLRIAFPLLDGAEKMRETGLERLLAQLEYYMNEEGFVLEHSPMYHYNGLKRIGAAWRYMGLLGESVPKEMARRYERALVLVASLVRPDKTLPPFGDTHGYPQGAINVARFDDSLIVSKPLRQTGDIAPVPDRLTVLPAAGLIIAWDGLQQWPDVAALSQTVVHWGNFPTRSHKHEDDLGISIWSGGVQWVRGIGYWPFGESRVAAIDWRSSNAPHWIDEPIFAQGASQLLGSAQTSESVFFDFKRRTNDESVIRRQLAKISNRLWIVLDSFESEFPRGAELIWRFSPEVKLAEIRPDTYGLTAMQGAAELTLRVWSNARKKVDLDPHGGAPWNSGVASAGEISNTPAIRFTATGDSPVLVSIFEISPDGHSVGKPELTKIDWSGHDNWKIAWSNRAGTEQTVQRLDNQVSLWNSDSVGKPQTMIQPVSKSALQPLVVAEAALQQVTRRYGRPFQAMFGRRKKVSVGILSAGLFQVVLFAAAQARMPRWYRPLFILSSISWAVLSFSIIYWYLA